MKKYCYTFLLILGVSFIVRLLFFSVYNVSSSSMEPTLFVGDRIIAQKISVYKSKIKKINIEHDDIIVFEPSNVFLVHQKYIKRCIGLPGDTIEIVNGQVKRNGKYVEYLNNIYKKERKDIYDESDYRIQFLNENIFPENKKIKYTILNFGPIIIPRKGMYIPLNKKNKILYNSIMDENSLSIMNQSDSLVIDTSLYVNKDYYFVMGDNYFESKDSRFWGFLRAESISDKAIFILFNNKNGIFKVNRVLKRIRKKTN